MANTVTFDPQKFRLQYPAFSNTTQFSDERLDGLFEMATCFVWPVKWVGMRVHCQEQALYLMVAHLSQLAKEADAGTVTAGVQTGATIDRVSVTLQAPPATSGWQAWLSKTPWGLQLWALLSTMSRGGGYAGGWPERAGFRKGGGVF